MLLGLGGERRGRVLRRQQLGAPADEPSWPESEGEKNMEELAEFRSAVSGLWAPT